MPLENEQVYRSVFAPVKNFPLVRGRRVAKYNRLVRDVLASGKELTDLEDDELRRRAAKMRDEATGGRPLDELLVPAYALVRETAGRVLDMRHYPVQILGGIGLHFGHMVEMATGEGKTLVSTLPAFLNALNDRGVHIVTVNDYLAQRDAEEMGQVHRFLGLTVGVITSKSQPGERMKAYRQHITYATNKELGFDWLRDSLRSKSDKWFSFGKGLGDLSVTRVQRRDFHFAMIDEVDSVLIDEARTPLIIAEAPPVDEETAEEFAVSNETVGRLVEDIDYSYERKERRVEWLKTGERTIGRLLGGRRSKSGHRIDWHESCLRALKAHVMFHRDVEYVVDDGEIVIVDVNTGRKMPGRQWEEGLHQAVAAKEGLEIKGQTETLARTTYQIYFNRYEKLSGMTGTAMTDASELAELFGTATLPIPTNRPCIRTTKADDVYANEAEKWQAIAAETLEMLDAGRSVLIGTRSVEKSEELSRVLEANGIVHVLLNARNEPEEAAIVARAGEPGRVTVATNMAGRGTDIKLDRRVAEAGGLHVIGTERHESRRIDNQLIGRAARQGDPGSARFIVSVEDPLIQRYRTAACHRLMEKHAGLHRPIPGEGIRRFFRRVQRSIERQHRKVRYQMIKHDRERIKFNQQIGVE